MHESRDFVVFLFLRTSGAHKVVICRTLDLAFNRRGNAVIVFKFRCESKLSTNSNNKPPKTTITKQSN